MKITLYSRHIDHGYHCYHDNVHGNPLSVEGS